MRFVLGVFIVLHGMVHLLYFGQSARYFELKPGMVWPDGSWAFSKLLGDQSTRRLACIGLVLAALGFLTGSVGLAIHQAWWRPIIVGSAAFSSQLFILLWDGKLKALDEKGGVGLLINLAIFAAASILNWPS